MICGVIFSFKNIHAPKATTRGVVVASSVAFAIEVLRMDRCQKNRSPANRKPIQMMSLASEDALRSGTLPPERVASNFSQPHRNGIASAMRQKALANGPTSASRTNMGDAPMATAPRTSAEMGSTDVACGDWGLLVMCV